MNLGIKRRAVRALERQLTYQQGRAKKLHTHGERTMAQMAAFSAEIRGRLEAVKPIAADADVIEVGSGAHGLIFYFGTSNGVGVDPLADHYRALHPEWQHRARTVAAPGEALPFPDASFDVALCDNVVDHAENPRRILEEIVRVMRPGALLYFEVNIHHPLYAVAAGVHAAWRAIGIPFEITPFADHTFHFTRATAAKLLDGLPLRIVTERDTIAEQRERLARSTKRGASDLLKRRFFKNAIYDVIAVRTD